MGDLESVPEDKISSYQRQRVRDVVRVQVRVLDEAAGCDEPDVGLVNAAELGT